MSRENILRVSYALVVLSGVLVGITLLLSGRSNPHLAGYVAVAGASFIFGGTGVPMKALMVDTSSNAADSKPVERMDSMIFAMYNGLGVFIVNTPILIYLLSIKAFRYFPISILASVDIFVIVYLAFLAVECLGYAKASAMWSGVGMLVAFLWGSLMFREEISNTAYAISAISLLVLGVYTVSTSQSNIETEQSNRLHEQSNDHHDKKITIEYAQVNTLHEDQSLHQEDAESKSEPMQIDLQATLITSSLSFTPPINYKSIKDMITRINIKSILGYLLCLATGFCDGTLMVPFKSIDSSNLVEVYNYLVSFGLSSLFVCPIMYILYIFLLSDGKIPYESLKAARVPGLIGGILWAAANFLSVHATYYLGIRIGFPLTQTCLIFCAIWGIFYFKEISVTTLPMNLVKFGFGVISLVLGSYFLAMSGN
jgi:glucose uptake protein GlcU